MRNGGVVESSALSRRGAYLPAGFDPDPRFRWIVVVTEFGQEHLALGHVSQLVGCAYLPQFYDPPRSAGARRMRLHRARARVAGLHGARKAAPDSGKLSVDPDVMPLFPGYLMAYVDLDQPVWRSIHVQRGVADVLRIAGSIGSVPQRVMHRLWDQCGPDGVIRPPGPPERIQPGAKVRMAYTGDPQLDSPFAGFEGICRYSSKDRVAVLLDLLGRPTEVSAPRHQVELVDATAAA